MLPGTPGHPRPQLCKPTSLNRAFTQGSHQQVPEPSLAGDLPADGSEEEASQRPLGSQWCRDMLQEVVPHLDGPPQMGTELSPLPPFASQGSLSPGTSKGLSVQISPADISGLLRH